MDGNEQEYVLDSNDYSIREFNGILSKTFTRMFTGLLVTSIAALIVYKTSLLMVLLPFYPLLAIAELVLVVVFSLGFRKMSSSTVTVLYYAYAILNGVTLSTILYIYDVGLIGKSFLLTSVLFGALAYYGHTTEKDLSKFGSVLMVALLVGLIATIINIFLKSSMMDFILDWVMLLIFSGLTIYDMNKMKAMSNSIEAVGETADKIYVYCAMQLYLDFINIFLRVLRIMSRSRKN